jgi:hypothetical protein
MKQSLIWQMVRIRTSKDSILNIPEGSVGCGCGQVSRDSAPSPPPRLPVSLEQLLATQNDLMRRLIENDERRGAKRQQPQHQERDSSYSDFLATHSPIFVDVTGPLEADSWLCAMESKFGLLHCTKYQKTLYAAQQLRGLARAWWASYIAALPADHHVPWDEFRTAFRAHHLSVGLLRTKLKEFLDLEQGSRSVFDYMRQFNTLAQYGSYHVDTDEKKANLYHEGLTIHLQERLGLTPNLSYNELVSAAIDQERLMKVVIPHLGVSCANRNSSRTGAIAHNSNRSNFSSNSRNSSNNNSSTMLRHHHHSRLQSGHHSRLLTAAFHASTVESWDIAPVSA